jgi:hypothetical protein|tara:strand:- start:348 stop:539 length:192 start_codon:yes stop_codon:yes gene_type:complete
MMEALLITSRGDGMRWYADKVGEIVPLLAIERTEYKSREDAGYINFVQFADAKIVEVPDARRR